MTLEERRKRIAEAWAMRSDCEELWVGTKKLVELDALGAGPAVRINGYDNYIMVLDKDVPALRDALNELCPSSRPVPAVPTTTYDRIVAFLSDMAAVSSHDIGMRAAKLLAELEKTNAK